MAIYSKKIILVLLLGLIQFSSCRTVPHAHRHCPEHSYVAGVSLSRNSDDSEISSIRFYCTRPGVVSEFNKHGFIQYDVETANPEVEKEWTEPWLCQRGIATGIQITEPSDEIPAKFRLICSDKSVPEAEEASWSDLNKCSSGQAICGVHALPDGTTGVLNSLSTKCCDIPHPASTCKTSDIWRVAGECANDQAAVPKTCTYSTAHGINYAGKDNERSIYEDLGFDLASAGPILAAKPDFQLKTESYDWSNSSEITWSLESTTQELVTVQPGFKTKVLQVIGYCGFYKVSTPFFKTETGQIVKHAQHHKAHLSSENQHHKHDQMDKKHSDKWDDTEGMQEDMADSWEDDEVEETPVFSDPKQTIPLAEEHKTVEEEDSDDWSDETESEPLPTAEVKVDNKPMASAPIVEADSNEWDDSSEKNSKAAPVPETKSEAKPEVEAVAEAQDEVNVAVPETVPNKQGNDESDEWGNSGEVESDAAPEPKVAEPMKLAKEPVKEESAESDEWGQASVETQHEPDAAPKSKHIEPEADKQKPESKEDDSWETESSDHESETKAHVHADSVEKPQEPISLAMPAAAVKEAESEESDDWDSFDDHEDNKVLKKADSSEVEFIDTQESGLSSEKLQVEPKVKTGEDDDTELMAKDVPEDSWESSDESIEPVEAAPVPAPVPVPEIKPEVVEDSWETKDSEEKLDGSSSNVEPVAEIRIPILPGTSDAVDSRSQTFGMLRQAPASSDSDQSSMFDLGAISDKMKNIADQVQVGASDLADQIQAGSSGFIDETKKVIQEVKEMPIVQDIGKNIQDSMKKSLGAVNGVDLTPAKPAEVEETNKNAEIKLEETAKSGGDEAPNVSKAGGYIGYIVGGMVICVIIVVIAIFVIEKRQSPTPEPKLNKQDYTENPAPEPLLAGARDRKITIEAEA